MWTPTAPEARQLVQGCPLGPRGAPSLLGCRGEATLYGLRSGACPKPSTTPPLTIQAQGAWAWDDGDRVSHITVLLYLNDDFDGGQTLLHPPARRRDLSKAEVAPAPVQPRRSRKQRRRLKKDSGGGLEGGLEGAVEGAAEGGPEVAAAVRGEERPPSVALTPVAGSALCFGQSFSFGRNSVEQQAQSAVLVVPQLTTLACWSRLSRLLAARRTRDVPLSRSEPNGRLRCGLEAGLKLVMFNT